MISRLTPVRYGDVADIATDIIPPSKLNPYFKGTFVTILLEPNQYANQPKEKHENQTVFFGGDKLSVNVYCKGHLLGMLPELYSVTDWKGAEDEWTKAVEAIRTQLDLEYCAHGYIGTKDDQKLSGFVSACRYKSGENYADYDEYVLLKPEQQKAWELEQCSVKFPVEVL